jgi:hypothetical protein
MATPAWHAVATGGPLSVGDITQFLGTHGGALLYQGVSKVTGAVSTTNQLTLNAGAGTAQYVDQPFTTAALQTTITRIEVTLAAGAGVGADTTVGIYADAAGVPTGAPLATCFVPLEFNLTANVLSIPFNLSGLVAATKYHIVFSGTTSSTNYSQLAGGVTVGTAAQYNTTGVGSAWTSWGFTLVFVVYSGVNGVLRNTIEDAGARWTTIDYTNSVAAGNTTPVHIGEYTVGSLRSWRTCTFVSGQLTAVA